MAAGEMGIGGVLRSRCESNAKIRDTGSKKMAEACPAKIARGKIPTRYQGLALRVAVSADFRFLIYFFP